MRYVTLLALFALLFVACDSSTEADTKTQEPQDLVSSQDIPEIPGGYEGIETLCPVIVACDFGFTQEACLAEFISYCKEAGRTAYVDCMEACHTAYTSAPDCDPFRTCETNCWNNSGC